MFPQLQRPARKAEFRLYDSCQNVNNKRADQTARMRRLICTFIVCRPQTQEFSRRGPYENELTEACVTVIYLKVLNRGPHIQPKFQSFNNKITTHHCLIDGFHYMLDYCAVEYCFYSGGGT